MSSVEDADPAAARADLQVLDALSDQVYEDVARLARTVCATPVAAVILPEDGGRWSRIVPEASEDEKAHVRSLCDRAMRDVSRVHVVGAPGPDAGLRGGAATAILDEAGRAAGAVCVTDRAPREFSADQRAALQALARQAGAHRRARALCLRTARVGERLRWSWSHDELTDLATRGRLQQALSSALSDPRSGPVGLVYCDLDGFKEVNDDFGHRLGDELLRVVGRRLLGAARSGDLAARLGGDEFVVLCCGVGGLDDLAAIAQRIEIRLAAPARLGQTTLHPTASVGTALAEPGESADAFLHRADQAMFAHKRAHATGRVPVGRSARVRPRSPSADRVARAARGSR